MKDQEISNKEDLELVKKTLEGAKISLHRARTDLSNFMNNFDKRIKACKENPEKISE